MQVSIPAAPKVCGCTCQARCPIHVDEQGLMQIVRQTDFAYCDQCRDCLTRHEDAVNRTTNPRLSGKRSLLQDERSGRRRIAMVHAAMSVITCLGLRAELADQLGRIGEWWFATTSALLDHQAGGM